MLAETSARALNHLLDADPALRARLAPFAGERLELQAPPLPALRLAVAEGGRLAAGNAQDAPTLTIRLKPGALGAAAKGEDALLREVEIAGNARLATEVLFLIRHLRWDAEEDLARVVGDAAAHRLALAAREVAGWHLEAARRVAEGVMEYAIEERPLLVTRPGLDELARASARLRDDLDRLERRLRTLEAPGAPR